MDRSVLWGLAAVAAVVVVGLLMRRGSGSSEATALPAGHDAADVDPDAAASDGADDDDELEEVEVVAVTSEGDAVVPDTHAVRLVPPPEAGEAWKAGTTSQSPRGQRAIERSWHAGDFTGARVVRGEADEGPWRMDALGRDGEYTALVFETREGADAALKLFQSRRVIRLGRDEDGHEVPPSAEQFEEARRIYLETEAALEFDED
jgi:hypothetical protein